MNLGQARTELLARGFDYLSVSRANQYLADANQEFNDYASWPWLETFSTGTAPFLISDLKDVLFVVDISTQTELQNVDVRDVADMDPATVATGSPVYYWLDNETVNVWPPNTTDTLKVRYVKVPADLAADGDTPIMPTRYHTLWVSMAQARVLLTDASDDSLAQQLIQRNTADLQQAASVLMNRMYDAPSQQVMNSDPDSSIWRVSY